VSQGDLTPQQVDSVYAAGQLRIFQHILVQVPPNSTPDVEAQKRRKAEQLLPQARSAGTRFGQLASANSDDPGSKVQGGTLGLTARGQFVPAFEDAAWQLKPGEVSAVVKSPFGFHIIRRPPLAEVRESFRSGVQERIAGRTDSLYLDSLAIKKKIEPVSRAPEYVRAAMQDLEAARTSNRVLVDYRGGSLRVKNLVRWLSALDPQVAQSLPQASDDQIKQFLKAIAQRDLLIQQADSAKVMLTPQDWEQIRAEHDSAIMMLGSILNISPQMLRDSASSQEERTTIAMARVNDYVESRAAGPARGSSRFPFPGRDAGGKARWSVDEAGVRSRGRARAGRSGRPADSSRTNAPRMLPAPGPGAHRYEPARHADPGGSPQNDEHAGVLFALCALGMVSPVGAAQEVLDRIRGHRGHAGHSRVGSRRGIRPGCAGAGPAVAARLREPVCALRRQILDRYHRSGVLVQQDRSAIDTAIKITELGSARSGSSRLSELSASEFRSSTRIPRPDP
jgi:hypothetical protein